MQASNLELAATVVRSVDNSSNASHISMELYQLYLKCVGFKPFSYYLQQWLGYFPAKQVKLEIIC